MLYPSRNNYPAKSIALFERASAKVSVIEDIDPLTMWTGRVSLLHTASAWSPTLARWNRMTKRPEAARETH